MPTLKIDGQDVTVEKSITVIEAAKKIGIDIPHYCYHPGLSIAGNCRMCLVDVEKSPKPVISCQAPCGDGMVVHTNNEKVKKLREAVLEFLLINHPLDCPVCDQAGECSLQDFYMKYGLYDARFDEQKVRKHKAIPLGETVMLDSERCVLCSRCTRFTDEITKTNELGIFNRGDKCEVGLVPGKVLDNPYSGNVVDICPVGALTDTDFRFKCRVWYLKPQESVCPGCSRGCNIRIDSNLDRPQHGNGKRVMRLKPRENQEVNQWWICDEGRYGYHFIDDDRILTPLERAKGRSGVLTPLNWEEGLGVLASYLDDLIKEERLKDLGVIASTHLTNEDLFAVSHLFRETLGFPYVHYRMPVPDGTADPILRTSDKSPNTRGAEEIFKKAAVDGSEMILKARKGELKALIVFGYDLKELFGAKTCEELRSHLDLIVFIGSNVNGTMDYADLVLPASVYAEKDGTFTNCDGRVQRIRPAFSPLGEAKPETEIVRLLADRLGEVFPFKGPDELFRKLAETVPAFQGLTYQTVGRQGVLLNTKTPVSLST